MKLRTSRSSRSASSDGAEAAPTIHRQLTEAQQIAAGAEAEVVRLSIGLETVEDLIADLGQALWQAP